VSQNNVPRVDLVSHARGCHCGQYFETPFAASS